MDFEIFQIAQNVDDLQLNEEQITGLLETASELYQDVTSQEDYAHVGAQLEETIYWLKIRQEALARKHRKKH